MRQEKRREREIEQLRIDIDGHDYLSYYFNNRYDNERISYFFIFGYMLVLSYSNPSIESYSWPQHHRLLIGPKKITPKKVYLNDNSKSLPGHYPHELKEYLVIQDIDSGEIYHRNVCGMTKKGMLAAIAEHKKCKIIHFEYNHNGLKDDVLKQASSTTMATTIPLAEHIYEDKPEKSVNPRSVNPRSVNPRSVNPRSVDPFAFADFLEDFERI